MQNANVLYQLGDSHFGMKLEQKQTMEPTSDGVYATYPSKTTLNVGLGKQYEPSPPEIILGYPSVGVESTDNRNKLNYDVVLSELGYIHSGTQHYHYYGYKIKIEQNYQFIVDIVYWWSKNELTQQQIIDIFRTKYPGILGQFTGLYDPGATNMGINAICDDTRSIISIKGHSGSYITANQASYIALDAIPRNEEVIIVFNYLVTIWDNDTYNRIEYMNFGGLTCCCVRTSPKFS